jgi:hypothetical protein
MAKSKNNVVTHGLSGKIGDLLLFRQRDGQTIVSKIPEQPKKASEKQVETRKRFQQATIYAKVAMSTPEIKDRYDKKVKDRKGMTAYSIAVADYFNAPDIELVDLSAYNGIEGDEIRIIAVDDFAVNAVNVQISAVDGVLIEEGNAVNTAGNLWIYTAKVNNQSLDGNRIVVTASDLPGNVAVDSVEL